MDNLLVHGVWTQRLLVSGIVNWPVVNNYAWCWTNCYQMTYLLPLSASVGTTFNSGYCCLRQLFYYQVTSTWCFNGIVATVASGIVFSIKWHWYYGCCFVSGVTSVIIKRGGDHCCCFSVSVVANHAWWSSWLNYVSRHSLGSPAPLYSRLVEPRWQELHYYCG